MSEEDIEIEESTEQYIVTSAIFHILDYSSGMTSYSQTTLNLEDPFIEKYVLRYVKKIQKDLRNRKGYFNEESILRKLLDSYKQNEFGFVDLSVKATEEFDSFLKNLVVKSFDVLFVNYRYDEIPYIAMILLESQQGIMHTSNLDGGLLQNTLMVQNALMPATSKKVNTFCTINMITYEIAYTDETNWGSSQVQVMQDVILDCSSEKSNQEIIQKVSEIVTEVAVTYEENPSIALAQVKHAIRESAKNEEPFEVDAIADTVFEHSDHGDEIARMYHEKVVEAQLPKEVDVDPVTVSRKLKNQKIKTDTGIELSFPIEYFQDPEKIEFINHEDGTISIEIKNVGKIMNRK